MDARRVLAETRRQMARPGTLRILAGFALLVGSLAVVGTSGGGRTFIAIEFGYYLFPMLMCPIAAQRVLGDRDWGMAEVLATTPLTQGEALVARVAAMLSVPVVAIAFTLPVFYGLFAVAAPGAFWTALVHVPWALGIATASASVGLVVGHLTPQRPRLGLAIAFMLVVAWFVGGVSLNDFQDPGWAIAFLGKLSPYTYVDLATPLRPIPAGPLAMLVGPLVLTLVALAVLIPIGAGLQHPVGWDRPLGRHPVAAVSLAGVLLVGGGLLAAWTPPENPWRRGTGFPVEDTREGLRWSIALTPGEEAGKLWKGAWGDPTPLRLSMAVTGPPNATLSIDALGLTSERIDFEPAEPLPDRLVLDSIQDASESSPAGTGDKVGVGTVEILWNATPTELFQRTDVLLFLEVNGEPIRFEMDLGALGWKTSDTAALAGSLASALPALAATRWLPPRWNRW